MAILIIDMGKYVPNGENYNESINLYKFLKDNHVDVDIHKYFYFDKPYYLKETTLEEVKSKRYNLIISYSPLDFELIKDYIRNVEPSVPIIFIDRYSFMGYFMDSQGLIDFNKREIKNNFKSIFSNIRYYFTMTDNDKDLVEQLFSGYNVEALPMGIDLEKYQPRSKSSYNYYGGEKPILYFGRLNYKQNNFNVLLKAVKYIASNKDFIKNHKLIIDISLSGEDEKLVFSSINKNGLGEYFRSVPLLPDNDYKNYISSHLFGVSVPNKYIDMKSVLIMMSAGLPVLIGSNFNKKVIPSHAVKYKFYNGEVDIGTQIVRDTWNGLFYNKDDYIDLGEKIMLMMSMDISDMRTNSIATAKNFSIKSYYVNIYRAVNDILSTTEQTKEKEINQIKS